MGNAHEGQVTTGAHAAERLIEGRLVAHRLDDAVGTQAVGQFLDARDALFAALFDDVGRSGLAGQRLAVRVARRSSIAA